MRSNQELTKVKYGEWLGPLVGACFVVFVFGARLNDSFEAFSWPILIVGMVGVLLYLWGMSKIYQRNIG